MSKFYEIEPEVAGGLGDSTILDSSIHPPKISKLNYCFDGWLGDSLLETFPCYIATETLVESIEVNRLTGIIVDDVEISLSETFKELYPNVQLPLFKWLKIAGQAGNDDFGILNNSLIISYKALSVLKSHKLQNCDIKTWQ